MPAPTIPITYNGYRSDGTCPYSFIVKVWEWQHSMMTGCRRNGKKYSTTYPVSAYSEIMNTARPWIFSRQDSCTIQTKEAMTEMLSCQQERNSSISQDSQKTCSPGMNGAKPWDTTNVIKWLESPDGEYWSRERNPDGHITFLISLKDDDGIIESTLWHR